MGQHSAPSALPQSQTLVYEDEINLGDIVRFVYKYRLLILCTAIVCASLAAGVALLMGKTFNVEAVVSKPELKDIEALNRNAVESYSLEQAYSAYFERLSKIDTQRAYFEQQALYEHLIDNNEPYSRQNINQAFARFQDVFRIEKIRPNYLELQRDEKTPLDKVRVSLQSDKPAVAAEFINGFIQYAAQQTLATFATDQAALKRIKEEELTKQIQTLKEQTRSQREAKIAQLEEENNIKILSLQDKITALIEKARFERNARIAKLQEALVIATALGIEEPRSLDDFNSEQKAAGQIAINTNLQGDKRPLYLMGSKFLAAEIEQLQKRENDEYFTPELGELRKELALAKQDREIQSLKNRKNDELFIEGLPEIQNQLKALALASLNFDNSVLFKIEQPGFVPEKPVGPSKLLIGTIAFVIGLCLGLVIALFKHITDTGQTTADTDQSPPASQPENQQSLRSLVFPNTVEEPLRATPQTVEAKHGT